MRLIETKWYAFAIVGGFGSLVWPHFYDGQTEFQRLGCALVMFLAWGIGDVLRSIRLHQSECTQCLKAAQEPESAREEIDLGASNSGGLNAKSARGKGA